jgi:hypothetical protein
VAEGAGVQARGVEEWVKCAWWDSERGMENLPIELSERREVSMIHEMLSVTYPALTS